MHDYKVILLLDFAKRQLLLHRLKHPEEVSSVDCDQACRLIDEAKSNDAGDRFIFLLAACVASGVVGYVLASLH